MNHKQEKFEKVFSDNFRPSALDSFVQKHESYRADVMSEMIANSGGTFVDFACGDGLFLKKVAMKFDVLIGFDISHKRVNTSKKKLARYHNKTKLFVHDLDNTLPLFDKTVDVAVCEASLGCLVAPDQFLKEVRRVLKDDGEFVVQIGNFAYILRRLQLLFGRLPKISSFPGFGDGGMLHYFTYSSLKDLLSTTGFEVVEQSNSGVLAKVRSFWPELLAADIIYRVKKKNDNETKSTVTS